MELWLDLPVLVKGLLGAVTFVSIIIGIIFVIAYIKEFRTYGFRDAKIMTLIVGIILIVLGVFIPIFIL